MISRVPPDHYSASPDDHVDQASQGPLNRPVLREATKARLYALEVGVSQAPLVLPHIHQIKSPREHPGSTKSHDTPRGGRIRDV